MPTQLEMSERTRAALRQAAIDCLCELGYAKTTGVEIARRAGVTRGALHHHYPRGKIDLSLDIIQRLYQAADDKYDGELVDYAQWFAGRLKYFAQTEETEAMLLEYWATLNIVLYIETEALETDELRRAFEQRNLLSMSLRENLVVGTDAEKRTMRPLYQFLTVFLTGYVFYHFRLGDHTKTDGARQFAKHLLEVWQTELQRGSATPMVKDP